MQSAKNVGLYPLLCGVHATRYSKWTRSADLCFEKNENSSFDSIHVEVDSRVLAKLGENW